MKGNMKQEKPARSSLTFSIRNSQQIKEMVGLINKEVRKAQYPESELTLLNTAITEVCRKFLDYCDSLELTLSVLTHSWGIELHGEAKSCLVSSPDFLETSLKKLETYFDDKNIQAEETSSKLLYMFSKKLLLD
jgi:hypothetical protein